MTKKEVFVIAVDKTQQLLIAAPPKYQPSNFRPPQPWPFYDILCKLLNQGISKMTLCVPPHLHFYLFLQFFLMLCVRPTTFGHHQPRSPSCSPYDPLSTLNPAPTKFSCRQRNGQQNTTWTTIVICCMNIVAVFCYKSIYYYIGIIKAAIYQFNPPACLSLCQSLSKTKLFTASKFQSYRCVLEPK